jgi:Family of unknown function (DUF6600)
MKKLIIIILAIISFSFIENETKAMHGGYFYSALSPYGSWVELDYGVLAWRPTIMRTDWAPYSQGNWIWTSSGWYWDSYEPFGYIVFHYGRWYYDDYYGWMWIPGNDWAPAWVEWRYDDDYIGWAPLSPYASFSINVGIYFTNNYYVPYHYWNFVTYHNFCSPNMYTYYVAPKYKYRIYSRTKIRTNYDYYEGRVRNRGVDRSFVEVRSGQKIRQRDLYRESDPVQYRNQRDNNKERLVTYEADRDVLNRDNIRELKVEKTTRKSSLDISKVEMKTRDNGNQKREVSQNNSDTKVRSQVNTKQNDVQKRTEVNKNTDVRKNETGVSTSRNNTGLQKDVNREKQVQINTNRNTGKVNTERKVTTEKKQDNSRNDQKIIKKNTETQKTPVVTKSNTQKQNTEVRKQTTVQKNNSNTKSVTGTTTRTTTKSNDTGRKTDSNKKENTRKR